MPWLVFLCALGSYAWTAAPTVGWLDSAEFVAASQTLGVPHPPGHPIPTLLGRALMMLPAGDGAFRVNLASALAGAIAAVAVYWACLFVVRRVASALSPRAQRLLSAGAALGYALAGSAWDQSVRAEVYAVEAALVLAALAFVIRHDEDNDRRALYAGTLASGLALANHHFVTILFFIPAAIVVLSRRPGFPAAGRTAAFGLLGLAAFLYLPIRAAHDPIVDWGAADTFQRFAWTVSAKAFQKLFGAPPDIRAESVRIAISLYEQLGVAGALLALAGAVRLCLRRPTLRLGLFLGGVVAFGVAGRAFLGFDTDNPDAYGYLLPALGALFVLCAAGAAALLARVPGRAALAVSLAAALALPISQAWRFAAQSSLRDAYATEAYGRAVLESLPPRTLLITSYYETVFQIWELQAVEGDRPDITDLDRNMLTHPGSAAVEKRRTPALAALLDAPLRGGDPTPVAELTAIARDRPVALELAGNLENADPVLPHLIPRGLTARFEPGAVHPLARTIAEAEDRDAFTTLERAMIGHAPGDRLGAARVLTWNAFLDARLYCALRRPGAAQAAIARARAHGDPGDEALADLEEACLRP